MTRLSDGRHRLEVVLTQDLYRRFLAQLERDGIPTASEWVRARILEYVKKAE